MTLPDIVLRPLCRFALGLAGLAFALAGPALGQTNLPSPQAGTPAPGATLRPLSAQGRTLTQRRFFERVAESHPLVRQAVLYRKFGEAQLLEARGNFDPKLSYFNAQKRQDGLVYYDVSEAKGLVPLRAGLNLTGGYEFGRGPFVSGENFTSGPGLYFGGIELQAGRGLLIDARRAAVLQGKNAVQLGEQLTRAYANKVLSLAAKDYWSFYFAYHQAQFLREGVDLAQLRYDGVRQKFRVGEEAAIDTVEAEILLQDRSNQYLEAQNELRNARMQLQRYLWEGSKEVDPIDSLTSPEAFAMPQVALLGPDPAAGRDLIVSQNPDLASQRIELQQLDIDRRLALENFRPVADIKYQFINKYGSSLPPPEAAFFRNNYRFGLDLAMPLFLRKERGKLAQIRIKTEQARLGLKQAERDAEVAYRQTRNDLSVFRSMIETQARMVNNYRVLRDGESIKFNLGESSLFLVNTRETKLIESEVKLVALHAKWQKALVQLQALAGALTDGLTLPTIR